VSKKPASTGNRQERHSHRSDVIPFRPTEVDELIGDASKARQKLGWKPKTSFAQLVKEMVAGDLAIARREVANGKDPV
jgi:GDPmannose 4,6-dehydratase